MDERMPGIDGLRATQVIRNEMNIPETEMPVICISAATVNEDWQKYSQAGMNAFLQKPFTEETLMTTILSVIKSYDSSVAGDSLPEEKTNRAVTDKINLENLYHISGGDEEFVRQMLVSFIDSTRKGLDDMQEAAKYGQTDSIAEFAHKMLPPCRHIGANELFNILKEIEVSIKNKLDIIVLEKLTEKALAEFEVISVRIKEQIMKIS
jgi:CheY-like chemotaxis protein